MSETRGTKVLANGSVYDLDKGRIVKGPDHPPFTDRQVAADANRKRNELAQAKARARLAEALEQHTGKPGRPTDAYAELAGEFTRAALANAMDKPRDAVPAAKLALKLAGMLPDEGRSQQVAAVQVIVTAGRQLDAIEADFAVTSEDDDARQGS